MADEESAGNAVFAECEVAREDGQKAIDRARRQLRELRLLAGQIEAELPDLQARRAEREEQVRQIEAGHGTATPAELKAAYASLTDASNRQHLMQMQLDSLRQREQVLILQAEELTKFVNVLALVADLSPDLELGSATPATQRLASRELARRCIDAREKQSRQLSQTIQEGPVQLLSNLVMQAEISLRLLARNPERGVGELKVLKQSLADSLNEARRFATDIFPPALSEVGLVATLRRHTEEMQAHAGLPVRFAATTAPVNLAPDVELCLFRIAHEGLRYAQLLGKASELALTISLSPSEAEIAVGAAYETGRRSTASLDDLEMYVQAYDGELTVAESDNGQLTLTSILPLTGTGSAPLR